MNRSAPLPAIVALALGVASVLPAGAWTPRTQLAIADHAARMAPPDLYRQIDRHRDEFRAGVLAPFADADADRHRQESPAAGSLAAVILEESEAAARAIRQHRPFAEVVRQLGVVCHYLADANNPLNASAADPAEASYFHDYLRYVESAQDRFAVVFYGIDRDLGNGAGPGALVDRTLRRSRQLYPLIGREYRRIRAPGAVERQFDDRATAFGVSGVAFNQAVTDAAVVLRWIWIAAGGADPRGYLPERGSELVLLRESRAR